MRKKISLFLATLMTMIGVANMQSDTQVVQAADGIKLLVDSMTTQQKVAQMIMPAFRGWEGSGKFIVLSTQLPYDLATYADADGLVACYNSRGMAQIPTGQLGQLKYGPNIPAAVYAIFGGSQATGSLPVTFK